ncbi:MAG TPA: hypothetical protein VMU95_41310 [Trebonia sp.]|nr:hypothetical protein [Trebonia sp.]
MPISSTLAHVNSLLDGASIPGNAGVRLESFISAPDPETTQKNPHAYVWASKGPEKRNSGKRNTPPAGAPQPTPASTNSGFKILNHNLEIYLTWFNDNRDPQINASFPLVVDLVMNILRCCKMPMDLVDPATGINCQLINLGEVLNYEYVPTRSTASQRMQRNDALITAPVEEWIQA